jgi:cytochrome bd-type quinol oxidase subunit 1
VAASSVGISLVAFTVVYTFLGVIAFYLIYKNATKGADIRERQLNAKYPRANSGTNP